MKKLLAISFILFPLLAFAKEDEGLSVEMIEGPSNRPHSVITPLSSNKSHMEDAFSDLRKKAAGMGADAVIEYVCTPETSARGGGLIGIANKVKVHATCAGKAVKWTGEAPVAVATESAPGKPKKK